jgi:hypothetical protein
MPAKSKKQRRFFGLVHAIQKGEKSPSSVSRDVRKVARKMSPKSVQDFSKTSEEGLPLKLKMEMLSILKEFQAPMMLQEGQANPIAKEFTKNAIYDQYIQKFVGIPFSQKELESIGNYTEVKPSKIDKNQVRYESSDPFNNNTTTVIKKLREGSQFSYTAFTKYTQTKPKEEPDAQPEQPAQPGQPPQPPVVEPTGPQPEDVIVAKSIAFTDDISGSKILSDFLRKLDL